MAVEFIEAQAIPALALFRRSRITDTKDWKDAVAALPSIKPGKAIRIVLSLETIELSKHAGPLFKRRLVDHIKESKLKLEVSLRKTPEGVPALYVANPAAK
jgi:hypothetical protein